MLYTLSSTIDLKKIYIRIFCQPIKKNNILRSSSGGTIIGSRVSIIFETVLNFFVGQPSTALR